MSPLVPGAPPPTVVDGRSVVAPDIEAIDARLHFDVAARTASGSARLTLHMVDTGHPAVDLRQGVAAVRLDGATLPPAALERVDLGGGPGAAMLVLDRPLAAGSRHDLEVDYPLATPDARDAVPIDWRDGGVRFDFWMSDLHPGRYLEMWIPAPLCHDRFALGLDLAVTGTDRPHLAVTNAGPGCVPTGAGHWRIDWPDHFTSLSPMLVVAPADEVAQHRATATLTGRPDPLAVHVLGHTEVGADLAACAEDIVGWLAHLSARYGPWVHGEGMTAFVWDASRGMEYDGATTSAVNALEHEVFHSWFGRGVKPARASDGWIDEAWTTWSTVSGRSRLSRFPVEALPLDAEPMLLCPAHPWSRSTPEASYAGGARLFAGVAAEIGGADRLRSAMAAWYRSNAGGLVDTDGLGAHLSAWSGVDLAPWWRRFVHGLQ